MRVSTGGPGGGAGASLRRHGSTPELTACCLPPAGRWHSQQDFHSNQAGSLSRGRALPPPAHPPPPPPACASAPSAPVMSSFRPSNNAKLYDAPEHLNSVAYRSPSQPAVSKQLIRKTPNLHSTGGLDTSKSTKDDVSPYAQPVPIHEKVMQTPLQTPPPIPEPDYSMSESEEEVTQPKPQHVEENSANSNASGSSSGSSSLHHSLSVEEIKKMRMQLKSSKTYPHDFAPQETDGPHVNDDGDNSSSGVSSDQELTVHQETCENPQTCMRKISIESSNNLSVTSNIKPVETKKEKVSFNSNVTVKSSNNIITTEPVHLHSSSESISSSSQVTGNSIKDNTTSGNSYRTGDIPNSNQIKSRQVNIGILQRHNSLTRKQASNYLLNRDPKSGRSAAERLGVNISKAPLGTKDSKTKGSLTKNAVSLTHLPPPVEETTSLPPDAPSEVPPLAPPPEFSDKVRIVGAVPKQTN